MSLDVAALRKAAKRLKAAHETRADARQTTGATAMIRAALPEIRRLRDEGLPWAVIAAALAEQGVRQGKDAQPITADRLIALVRHVEGQQARDTIRQAGRASRADLRESSRAVGSSPLPSPRASSSTTPRLAPELQTRPPSEPEDAPLDEAEIRRLQADKHRHLFKKD